MRSSRHEHPQRGRRTERGASVLGLLLVLAILALAVTWIIGTPTVLSSAASNVGTRVVDLVEGGAQARAIRDMRTVASANARMRMEHGHYAESLEELGEFSSGIPRRDPWGRAWNYSSSGTTWRLRSYGADGTPGPAPPSPWRGGHEDVDLIMVAGEMVQAPVR